MDYNICINCCNKVVPAGVSNQIQGRRYKGLKELADTEWVVCPECFEQDEETGDWKVKD